MSHIEQMKQNLETQTREKPKVGGVTIFFLGVLVFGIFSVNVIAGIIVGIILVMSFSVKPTERKSDTSWMDNDGIGDRFKISPDLELDAI